MTSLSAMSLVLGIQKVQSLNNDMIRLGMLSLTDNTFFGRLRYNMFNRNIGSDPVTLQWLDQEVILFFFSFFGH